MHNFQFVIGKHSIKITDDTSSLKLSNSKILSYDSRLPVIKVSDSDGKPWYILGWVFQTNNTLDDPATQIQIHPSTSIPSLLKDWGGRWILIGNNTVYLDAGGSFGCYYSIIDNDIYISSSVSILNKIKENDSTSAPDVNHSVGLDFYPGIYTKYESIYRLLPSQTLRFDSDEPVTSYRTLYSGLDIKDYDRLLSFIEDRLITTIKKISLTENDIWIPLTAGNDSRLILAAAHKAGIEATTFTYNKPFTKMSMADKTIPPKLAKEIGYKHVIINRDTFSEKRTDDFDIHSAKMIPGIDRHYYGYGQLEKIPKSAFLLRGGMFELGRCYYYNKLVDDVSRAQKSIYHAFGFDKNHKNSEPHFKGIDHWLNHIKDNPEPVDWRDRFYYDIRMGSWLSSVEQSLDITEIKRAHVANNHYIFSALLNIPINIRKKEKHVTDLIERMSPNLLKYPINPQDSFIIKGIRKLAKKINKQ